MKIVNRIQNKDERITVDIHPLKSRSRFDKTFEITIFSAENPRITIRERSDLEQINVDGDIAEITFNQEIAEKFAEAILETITETG